MATVDEGAGGGPARAAKAKADAGRGWYALLARGGLVAKGISYGIVGLLALQLVSGDGGRATSREGALHAAAQEAYGKILIALLAVGFAAYASWRFVQAFAERDDEGGDQGTASTAAKRAGYVGRGLIYAALTFSSVRLVAGAGGHESQNEKAHRATGTLFDWPGGRWLVGIAGAVLVGVGIWNAYRGVTRKFEDRWRGAISQAARKWGGFVGAIGHLARGVVFSLAGVFIAKAAVEFDPKEAIGLDGALQKLARADYGPFLLGLTAAGLIAYGLYCLVDARYRDVSTNR